MSYCRVISVVVSAIAPYWLASVVMNLRGDMRGHRERLDAVFAPIPTPFATLVLTSMLVALVNTTKRSPLATRDRCR